jgi:hypothetical protein
MDDAPDGMDCGCPQPILLTWVAVDGHYACTTCDAIVVGADSIARWLVKSHPDLEES